MNDGQYERSLKKARADLKKAYGEREFLERRIAKLRQTVVTLGTLCEEPDATLRFLKTFASRSGKLTDSVRNAMIATDSPLSPAEIRDLLVDLGYRFQSTNPLASIHSVIKRMVEQKDVKHVRAVDSTGKVNSDRKYWHDIAGEPPKPWVAANEVRWDSTIKTWVLRDKPEESEE